MTFLAPLYFVALIPPEKVKEEVLKLKLEIKEKYNAVHALKLPAHLTLLPPFRLEESQEPMLIEKFAAVAEEQNNFNVKLKDFGHFGQRVIFINVENPEPVINLHRELQKKVGNLIPQNTNAGLHPHITLATRDLSRENYINAWADFKTRSFTNSFLVQGLFLLKHNGKSWDILKEFPFQS